MFSRVIHGTKRYYAYFGRYEGWGFATLDEYGNPHARHAHITAANEEGIFFMTSPETHFYDQLMGIKELR